MASKTLAAVFRCWRSIFRPPPLQRTRLYSSSSSLEPNNSWSRNQQNNVPSELLWNLDKLSNVQPLHHCLKAQDSGESIKVSTNLRAEDERIRAFIPACGWPSIPHMLQDASLPGASNSLTPMLLHTKRTYQPSNIRRKRKHGFLKSLVSEQTRFQHFSSSDFARFLPISKGDQRWTESYCTEVAKGTSKNYSLTAKYEAVY